ncbi:MAG: hypothetical protein GY913_05010 [Proteobacteria bacterium]|nr:hypothetical protein [Pseudomonadota bacterium]MCP4916260.1 hypothetical protein [Pseudomonadota bacterium]
MLLAAVLLFGSTADAASPVLSTGWLDQVHQALEADRRDFHGDAGVFTASAPGFHASLDVNGLSASGPQDTLTIELSAWGRDGFLDTSEPVAPL